MRETVPQHNASEDSLFWSQQARSSSRRLNRCEADINAFLKERERAISSLFGLCESRFNQYSHLQYTAEASGLPAIEFQAEPLEGFAYVEWQLSREDANPGIIFQLQFRGLHASRESGLYSTARLSPYAAEVITFKTCYSQPEAAGSSAPYIEQIMDFTAMLPEQIKGWSYYFHDAEAAAVPAALSK